MSKPWRKIETFVKYYPKVGGGGEKKRHLSGIFFNKEQQTVHNSRRRGQNKHDLNRQHHALMRQIVIWLTSQIRSEKNRSRTGFTPPPRNGLMLYYPIMLSHSLHSLENYTRRAIIPETCKINQQGYTFIVNLSNHFDVIGSLDSYRPICFYGGGAKLTLNLTG